MYLEGRGMETRTAVEAEAGEAHPTLAVSLVDNLQAAILHGEYPPGSALREVALSKKFETSRSTVREALRVLGETGLVIVNSRRGAVVASLTARRAHEIFSLRALLESHAANLAITEGRIGRRQIAVLEATFEDLRKSVASGDPFKMIEADMAFHWALCAPCGHDLLLEQLRNLQIRTRLFIFLTKFYDSDAETEIDAHYPILTAVRAYDAERTRLALHAHIMRAGERLLIRMNEVGDPVANRRIG